MGYDRWREQRGILIEYYHPGFSLGKEERPRNRLLSPRDGVHVPPPRGALIPPLGLDGYCLLFRYGMRNGYGGLPEKRWAHREAYRMAYGGEVNGTVNHICGRRSCFQPAHLYLGNPTLNSQDKGQRYPVFPHGVIGRPFPVSESEWEEIGGILLPYGKARMEWFTHPSRQNTLLEPSIWRPAKREPHKEIPFLPAGDSHEHKWLNGSGGTKECQICERVAGSILSVSSAPIVAAVQLTFREHNGRIQPSWDIVGISNSGRGLFLMDYQPGEFFQTR